MVIFHYSLIYILFLRSVNYQNDDSPKADTPHNGIRTRNKTRWQIRESHSFKAETPYILTPYEKCLLYYVNVLCQSSNQVDLMFDMNTIRRQNALLGAQCGIVIRAPRILGDRNYIPGPRRHGWWGRVHGIAVFAPFR